MGYMCRTYKNHALTLFGGASLSFSAFDTNEKNRFHCNTQVRINKAVKLILKTRRLGIRYVATLVKLVSSIFDVTFTIQANNKNRWRTLCFDIDPYSPATTVMTNEATTAWSIWWWWWKYKQWMMWSTRDTFVSTRTIPFATMRFS